MPYYRYEQTGREGYEAEKEYHDYGMLLVHEVVAQAGTTVRDAAIGETHVESTERGRDVYDEETVEETNRCVPGIY